MGELNTPWWLDVPAMLLRRRALILLVFVAGSLAAAALAVLQHPTYVATAKLMLSPERADLLVSPEADARPVVRTSNQDVNSEVALLRSTDLVRQVLEPYRSRRGRSAADEPDVFTRIVNVLGRLPTLPLQLYRQLHAVPSPDAFQIWVLAATDRVTVMPIGRSNLLSVSYQDADPTWAAEFVNQLVSRHVERRIRLNQQLDARRFYGSQRDLLRERIGEAEAALRQFTEREGTQAVPEQRAAGRTRLAEIEAAMGAADTELAESAARVAYLSKLSEQMRASGAASSLVAQNDPKQLVQSRILELELQRSELLSKFAPTSIKVQDIDRQLAEARRLLADAGPAAGFMDSTRQTLETDLAQARVQIAAVTARKEALRQQVDTYRTKLRHLDEVATEYDHLVQEAQTASQSFLTYVKKEEEARFSDALDESKIVNVIVAEPAQVPIIPQPSKAPLVLALGTGFSLIAGLAIAFVRDRLDPSVKSAGEAQRLTDLPVLADIPL